MSTPEYEITDNDYEVERLRVILHSELVAAEDAIRRAQRAVTELASPAVYDIEVAEGGLDAIEAALVQARNGVAAAHHLTRDAKPAT